MTLMYTGGHVKVTYPRMELGSRLGQAVDGVLAHKCSVIILLFSFL